MIKKMLVIVAALVVSSSLYAQEIPLKVIVKRYACATKPGSAGEELTLSRPLQTNEILQYRAEDRYHDVFWIDIAPTQTYTLAGGTNIFRMVAADQLSVYRVSTKSYPQNVWISDQTPVSITEVHVFKSGTTRFYMVLLSRPPQPSDMVTYAPAPSGKAILPNGNLYLGSDAYGMVVKVLPRTISATTKLTFQINDPTITMSH